MSSANWYHPTLWPLMWRAHSPAPGHLPAVTPDSGPNDPCAPHRIQVAQSCLSLFVCSRLEWPHVAMDFVVLRTGRCCWSVVCWPWPMVGVCDCDVAFMAVVCVLSCHRSTRLFGHVCDVADCQRHRRCSLVSEPYPHRVTVTDWHAGVSCIHAPPQCEPVGIDRTGNPSHTRMMCHMKPLRHASVSASCSLCVVQVSCHPKPHIPHCLPTHTVGIP